jgi:hypothetical protein
MFFWVKFHIGRGSDNLLNVRKRQLFISSSINVKQALPKLKFIYLVVKCES